MQNTHFTQPAVGGSISRKTYNPDLLEERAKLVFDPNELKTMLFCPGHLETVAKTNQYWRQYPEMIPTHEYFEMNRDEQMKWHWEKLSKQI